MLNEDIATVLATIITLGLALKAGIGPVVMYLTEALKDALKPPSGWGGLLSVAVGTVLGMTVGLLAALSTDNSGIGTYIAFGAVAGLFMASGAIESHKAAGDINSSGSTIVNLEPVPLTISGPVTGEIIEEGESDDMDWTIAREESGHVRAAIEVEPLPDIGEPAETWKGTL